MEEMLPSDPLGDRVRFLLRLDRLKTVRRRAPITDQTRLETAAEHSWHVAMFALVLAPHADVAIDLDRVVRMLLVHAIPTAGGHPPPCDTFRRSDRLLDGLDAERLLNPLPGVDGSGVFALWEEFEEGQTPEARFARSVDRLEPLLLHLADQACGWGDHGLEPSRLRDVHAVIGDGSADLWGLTRRLIAEAAARGWLTSEASVLARSGPIALRRATLDDLDAVLDLEHRPEHAKAIAQSSRTAHERTFDDPSLQILVATHDDAFAGYLMLSGVGSQVVRLERIAIADKGRGHGRAALRALFDLVYGEFEAIELTLDVVETNIRARRLYDSMGFQVQGLVRGFRLQGGEVTLVYMARSRDDGRHG
jgi:putative hydrolase of HD superfamily